MDERWVAALAGLSVVSMVAMAIKMNQTDRLLEQERKKRQDERTGRTRVQKLRELLNATANPEDENSDGVPFKPIGFVHSAFRDRRGTPRQGCLVPHSTAFIEFSSHVNALSSLDGLQEFSHVWVLGIFHENTNVGKSGGISAKIKPPRLRGVKVGLYSTRTPHRYNPISLSLAKIDKIETKVVKGKTVTRLWLSGIDLIHGTPILDIKPYLPAYDAMESEDVRVASWVAEEDADIGFRFDEVIIPDSVREEFRESVADKLEFYSPDHFLEAVEEILVTDIRSEFQRKLQHKLESGATTAYSFRLDTTKVEFTIKDGTKIWVTGISPHQEL
eukprot:TRINITY_DN8458_c0_g1_i1.p1 TRINITY_DN8458_c0_g1~~TRINITY_DN8458_c0_g1_i1.p1  ORF type:complete len:331 (-),score=45.50 TRINITY_DN8458_c0_g1_i1:133-1125(-)